MKALGIVLASGFLLAGCGQKSSQTSAPAQSSSSGGGVVSAPTDYLRAITKGEQSAVKTVDTTAVDKAIQMFNVDQGRFPKDLNELVTEKYLPQLPTPPYGTRLEYDASAGRVSVVKQ